jgi:diketogulonate reductase-like aldo/keto reductase
MTENGAAYGTEPMIGSAIKKSGIPRSEIFITTKLWNNSHAPEDVEPALDASLKDLGTDYVNLFLMHWPSAFKSGKELFPKEADGKKNATANISYVDTWLAMEKLLKTGKTKAIGISNFSRKEVEEILEKGSVVPAAHQLECHPWLQQKEFTEWQRSKGIVIQHYSPFGNQNEVYDSGKKMSKLMVSLTFQAPLSISFPGQIRIQDPLT